MNAQQKCKTVQEKPISLRIPGELRKWLKHQAVENDRSLNAEILARLKAQHQEMEVASAK